MQSIEYREQFTSPGHLGSSALTQVSTLSLEIPSGTPPALQMPSRRVQVYPMYALYHRITES